MKLFLQTLTRIRILNGDQEWQGTPAAFALLEPAYPGLPVLTQAPAVTRYQTPEWKYLEDAAGQRYPDMIDCLGYCEQIAEYNQLPPAIYVHVTLSQTTLNVTEPTAQIAVAAHLKATPTPTDPDLDINATWLIKLRHESGLGFDTFQVTFTQGLCVYNYRYQTGLPLGEWYLSESDFSTVTLDGQTYRVKLAAPVRMTMYRP